MHSLSTEGNKSPYQLLFEGLSCHSVSIPELIDSSNMPDQIDIQSNDAVHVPNNTFEPCPILTSLLLFINPLSYSTENGRDIFIHAINICGQHLINECSHCLLSN